MNTLQLSTLLVAIVTTHAFHQLIPPDKEAIFSWSAEVKAGTHLPVTYASQYALQGKIHLQPSNNTIVVKLTDLTHRLYNGIVDHFHEYEAKNVSLPPEVHDLENAFKITYTDSGLVEGISTQSNEMDFSRNIKKAIASIFQLNSTLLQKEYHRPESFVVKENSVYGHGDDLYSIFPQKGGNMEVHKLHNMPDSAKIYSHFVTNTEGVSCGATNGVPVMHDSKKTYVLEKNDDCYVVKKITAMGSIIYYPFKAKSDAQMILVNQNFDLDEVVPIKNKYQIGEEYFENSLSYVSFDKKTNDETNGRQIIDYDKLLPMVRHMLEDIPQYMHEDHINTKEPDHKRGQLINRVQQILLKFTLEKFKELQWTLSKQALNAFYHILPLVGTEASTLYIKTLIITKTVPDNLAVELLQNIAGHIRPSLDLVQKLEELIHLDSKYSWDVRKVAILSFGNIIYKSYVQQLQSNSDSSQEPYEKYVDEYIYNLRNSTRYIVQVTYLLGLRNMKLPILAQRLVPAFNGEWWSNQNLRYMAIWAAAPPILFYSGPDKMIENFWPIFTNRHEKMAVRAFCYYYIMYSRPSLTMLKNIFTFMLTEPDEELYRLHYTLVQTMIQSTDPCHQDAKLKLAQLIKFSPPPRRGTSGISFFGYRDEMFGFSGGIETCYLRTEDMRIYAYYLTSQLFDIYEEEWVFYWRIQDGRDKDPGLIQSLVDIVSLSQLDSFDFLIEASIARRGQVINTFAFDKRSLNEMMALLGLFLAYASKWNLNLLHINYERYNSYMIPTDLGIPAFWEYFMPEVHYNNLSVTKQIEGDSIHFRIENKYGTWIHYRHGLSFYNPIADVRQGINKYHAYDALFPLHFNLSLNSKLQNLEVHWRKHDDPQMNIAGIRTHATQLVFVRDSDDYEKKVLREFVPEGEEFQSVGHGKEFRHDYPIFDKHNLDTGYRLYLVNYDSDIHAPYGVFKNRLHMFADPSSKYFHSPLQHWAMAWLNFHRDIVLLPRPGTYGFVARLEPSSQFGVTNIDFALSQIFEYASNSSHVPGVDLHFHLVYSVKKHDQILKTWDLDALTEIASGHNYGSLKLKLSRIIPKQKGFRVCVEGYKKWAPEEVNGHWGITMGESDNGECVNDTVIDISSNGRRSLEQKSGKYKHSSCQNVVPYSAHDMKCLISHTTLRHYTYEVTSTNVPPRLKQIVTNLGEDLKSLFNQYYSYKIAHNENITQDSFKVDVTFPLAAHEINVEVATREQTYEFSGIPLKYWDWFKITPESTTYSLAFIEQYENGDIDHCIIQSDRRQLNQKSVSEVVPNEWTLYVANNLESHDHVYIKRLDDKIAVKLIRDDHTLEVLPAAETDDYHITYDGDASTNEHQEEWLHYRVFDVDIHKRLIIFLQQSGVHLEYDVRHVVITIPEETHWHGQCYAGAKPLIPSTTRNLFFSKTNISSMEWEVPTIEKISPSTNNFPKEKI
ncbi:hypothetical protein Zmor_015863 [Zophobas morio]|uniref:Vitellogenin domain-containing protein n=1 Tax=Zophobas morio TaxID=2755281 RepID=A0AA38IMU5_9CUCU|nr:hypothetical protein Zmor_015863 [Zophobas morio]